MFKYSCVTCGEEIKEEEMLVALAPLVLDGTTDYIKGLNPLYITKKDLDELIANTAEVEGVDERCNVISMEYLLQVAYRPINREKLIAPAKNAEEAYRTYLESYQRIKDKLAGKAEEEEEEKEEKASSGFSFFDDEEDDDAEESVWKGISIPGFNNEQAIQLCENFPDGQCNCRLRMKKGYGYSFKVLRDGTTEGVTPSFYCPSCKNEVMDCAFDKRQILVGFVGFQKVGKTCLILALCNYLMEEGGTLKIPHEDTYKEFIRQFTLYRNGQALPKTDKEAKGQNLLNPSVLIDDVIWTFVDISGELIKDDASGQLNVDTIMRNAKFKAILRCDAYILSTNKKELEEPINRSATSDIFSKFLQFASETETSTSAGLSGKGRHFPIILTMTQMDKQMEVPRPQKGDVIPYSADHYRLWKEYGGMMNEGMGRIIDSIINISYVTPISTSAYGFQPYDPEAGTDPEDSHVMLSLAPKETYRKPQPKNVDKIAKWVRQTLEIEDNVVLDDGGTCKAAFDDYDRTMGHWNDDQALSICQRFVNPSEWDLQWVETLGGGPLMWLKRKLIMRNFEKTMKGNV